MTYPVVVFIMAILMCTGMLIFIVPVFAGMFATLGGELPAPTKILVALSKGMKIGAPVVLVGIIAFFIMWPKIKNNRQLRDKS